MSSPPCLFLSTRLHGMGKALWLPSNVRKNARERSKHFPGVPIFRDKNEQAWGRVARCGSAAAVRDWDKVPGAICSKYTTTALPPLLFSHGHGSSRRFEGISPFLSSAHHPAHSISKAQRQQDPAQNSYELNPPQQPSNYGYTDSQNSNYGNNTGNGMSDNFFDEVSCITSSRLSQVFTQVSQPIPKISLF